MSETKYTLKEIETIRRLIRNKILVGYYIPIEGDWEDCYYDEREAVKQTEEELRTVLISGMTASSFIRYAVSEKMARLAHRKKMKEQVTKEKDTDSKSEMSNREFLDYYQASDDDAVYLPLYIIEEDKTGTFKVKYRQDKMGWFGNNNSIGYKTIARFLPSFQEAKRWATVHDCR